VQLNLLGHSCPEITSGYPRIWRSSDKIEGIISESKAAIGIDLEFTDSGKPSILGISSDSDAVSVPYRPEWAQGIVDLCSRKSRLLIGYASISSDKKVLDDAGVKTPLSLWDDGMLVHYLANQGLCKLPGKDEDDDPGALGFMNLWTATSLVSDVPNWKMCRGAACSMRICPTHDVWGYNAVDAWAGLKVWRENSRELDRMKVPLTFRREMLELTELCEHMREQGVRVDRSEVERIEKQLSDIQDTLFPDDGTARFNPRSGKQILAWFKDRGLRLADTQKNTLRDEMLKIGRKHAVIDPKPEEVADNLQDLPLQEHERGVLDLWRYKTGGKDLGAWFGGKYLREEFPNGWFMHPRFITTGTSLGRLSSSSPNMQNMKKYGLGKQSRAAIIPRDPSLKFLRFDYKQLEARMCMYLAGFDIQKFPKDLFTWLVNNAGGRFDKAAELAGKKPRDLAKITSHGSNYLMGIKVLTGTDLGSSYVKSAISTGALRVHRDWEYAGGVVAFTGKHLSEMLFGNASFENRKKALEIQEDVYFGAFPQIRAWQKRVLAEFEARGCVLYPTGRFLRLIGPYREDDAVSGAMEEDSKIVAAAYGQGVSADHVQAVMLRYKREAGMTPLLQIHDELVLEIPVAWSDKQCAEFCVLAQEETQRLPGFSCPVDAGVGRNWLEAMNAADKTPLTIPS